MHMNLNLTSNLQFFSKPLSSAQNWTKSPQTELNRNHYYRTWIELKRLEFDSTLEFQATFTHPKHRIRIASIDHHIPSDNNIHCLLNPLDHSNHLDPLSRSNSPDSLTRCATPNQQIVVQIPPSVSLTAYTSYQRHISSRTIRKESCLKEESRSLVG